MNHKTANVYLPGLNGLRAIAALSVVISHISIAFPEYSFNNYAGWGFAAHGVTLFFTISGFLITYLLLIEKNKQNIDIKKFYIRRVLRIWPLYYLYLGVSVICLVIYAQFDSKSVLYYIFFCANIPFIFNSSMILIAHLWSIGVEEQFYLFWPVFVRYTQKRLLQITVLIITLLIAIKFLARYYVQNELFKVFLDVNRFECMLIGAVGAMLFFSQNKWFITITTNTFLQVLAWVILFLMSLGKIYTPGPTEHVLMSIITLVIILGQIRSRNKIFNLENKIFDFLGKISYGLYVVHPLIIFLLSKILISLDLNFWIRGIIIYSSIIFSTILFAHLSYNYYEKPFLKLKSRFTIIKSQGSRYS